MPERFILGPILFFLYINDSPSVLKYPKCLLYADDAKFWKTVSDTHDCLKLKLDLNSIEVWYQSWKHCLNISKYSTISFKLNRSRVSFDYMLNVTKLLRVALIKDLGIFPISNLNFNVHIDFVIK